MRKFENVDIISTLRKIVNNNNLYYKTDFEYDVETLKEAAEGSRFLWMSRYSGTNIFDERETHIRNTYAHNTWQYYTDTMYYGVKTFAVEVTDNNGERPVGDIYELHYNKHREEVRKSSFNAETVNVTFKPAHWEKEAMPTTRTFEVDEYNENWGGIIRRYGQALDIQHCLSNEDDTRLAEILTNFKKQYEEEAEPADINDYVREMVKKRFHDYGYKRDDMVFTTPDDAYGAIKYKIPVFVLRSDNYHAIQVFNKKDITEAVYAHQMFGMSARDKQLLNFFVAGNTLANLPFTKDELKTILFMALDKGKENFEDKKDKQTIDDIINVLEISLFAIDSHNEITQAQEHQFDEGIEQ